MTELYGLDWYNLNAQRRYPLADSCTNRDDTGNVFPHDVIVDLHLRFPNTLGDFAYVSAVQLTSAVRTIVISVDAAPTPHAIAAVTVPASEFSPYRKYSVVPLVDGVAGWVAFGAYAGALPVRANFTSRSQSQLVSRTARAYTPLPVESISKQFDSRELTGTVALHGGTSVVVERVMRTIDDINRPVIRFALDDKTNPDIMSELAGPVGHRPESHTCNLPVIEQLNQVTPDCDGNIDLIFVSNCALVNEPVGGSAGLGVDFCFGLADACSKDHWLPKDGKLRNQYDDLCPPSSEMPMSSEEPYVVPPPVPAEPPCSFLPYQAFLTTWPESFNVIAGGFNVTSDGAVTQSTGGRCLAVWYDCAYGGAIGYACEAIVSLLPSGLENIGAVFDWREAGPPAHQEFFVADINKSTSAFRLRFFTGAGFVTVAEAVPIGIIYEREYRIHVAIVGEDPTTITATLYYEERLLATITYQTNLVTPQYGLFGIHANQSLGTFHSFRVEHA